MTGSASNNKKIRNIKGEDKNINGGAPLTVTPPGFSPHSNPNIKVENPSPTPTPTTTRKRGRPPGPAAAKHTPTLSIPISLPPPTKPIFDEEPTIESIRAKYGDIEKNCDLKYEVIRKGVLTGICNVLKELKRLKLKELNAGSLEKFYDAVKDAERLKIDVKWFRGQLDRIKEAIDLKVGAKRLIAQKEEQLNKFKKQEEELIALKTEKQKVMEEMALNITSKEKEMTLANATILCLDRDIAYGTTKFEHFKCNNSLLDGIL